jgi:hypothetical protein
MSGCGRRKNIELKSGGLNRRGFSDIIEEKVSLTSESGAKGIDRTGRRFGCMCRIAVGLPNHPLQKITGNYQYAMAA